MEKLAKGVVFAILAFVVVFYIVGGLSSTLTDSANNISGSGLPLASLFSSSGVLIIILMIGVLLALVSIGFNIHKNHK